MEKQLLKSYLRHGHSFGEWIIEKGPTTDEEGLKSRTCKNCNTKETEKLPKDKKENESTGNEDQNQTKEENQTSGKTENSGTEAETTTETTTGTEETKKATDEAEKKGETPNEETGETKQVATPEVSTSSNNLTE